jgi:hemerythrin-like domain-containing protein
MTKSPLTIKHALFDQIRTEHQEVKKHLDLLSTDLNISELKYIANFLWIFNELEHHYREETILFSVVAFKPKIIEGGPMCTLFFDFHMNEKPLWKAKDAIKEDPEIEKHQEIFYEMGSPLRIPLDEHRSGKSILEYTLKNWENLDRIKIKRNLDLYRDIQISHFKKEEECFLYMCVNLLSSEEADNLFEQWKLSLERL